MRDFSPEEKMVYECLYAYLHRTKIQVRNIFDPWPQWQETEEFIALVGYEVKWQVQTERGPSWPRVTFRFADREKNAFYSVFTSMPAREDDSIFWLDAKRARLTWTFSEAYEQPKAKYAVARFSRETYTDSSLRALRSPGDSGNPLFYGAQIVLHEVFAAEEEAERRKRFALRGTQYLMTILRTATILTRN